MVISVVGDISLHGIDEARFRIDPRIIDIFSHSSVVCGNLENPITNCEDVADHAIVSLKSSDRFLEILKHLKVVSLCNNHIFDFGINGYKDTVEYLKKTNINFFGAGNSQVEAQSPFIIKCDDNTRLAFIAGKLMTGPRWPDAKYNSCGTAGFHGYNKIIRELKEKNYFVVYYPHWGYEYIKTPPPNVRRHAKRMINMGVDLIIGSRPHVLQGFERYKNKYIFYSLGNFIFNVSDIEKLTISKYYQQTTQSMILNLFIKDNRLIKYDIIPVYFSADGVFLANPKEDILIKEDIKQMSKIFSKGYFHYCYDYYSQTPEIQKQNQSIYSKFDSARTNKRQSTIQKIKLMSMQGLFNRIAARIFSLTKYHK